MPAGRRSPQRRMPTGAPAWHVNLGAPVPASELLCGDIAPTVGITVPVMLFLRLTGGRTHAAAHRADIGLEGDAALAMQLASNLAFTI